jgi:hypothetical protein
LAPQLLSEANTVLPWQHPIEHDNIHRPNSQLLSHLLTIPREEHRETLRFKKLLQHRRKSLIIIDYQNNRHDPPHFSLHPQSKQFSGNILEIIVVHYNTIGSSGTQTKR